MGIKKDTKDGKTVWNVYVNLRSNRTKRRIQKYANNLESESFAKREERRLIREATVECESLDNLGLAWEDILHVWEMDMKFGPMKEIHARSFGSYRDILHHWTRPWYKLPSGGISKAEGRTLISDMKHENLSYTYSKKIINLIKKVYKWAQEERYIPEYCKGPFAGIILDRKVEKMPEILTLEEIRKFLTVAEAMKHKWYPIWAMAVLTGMRSGELHALAWNKIDLEKKLIYVEKSYDSNTKSSGPTKGRYWRTVPISDDLFKLFLQLKAGEFEDISEFVLPRIKDWDNGDQAAPLRNFLKSIKVTSVKFHTLRACFATQMLAYGVPAPIVMKIGGWKNSSTMDVYLRLAGVEVQGATDCLKFMPSKIDFGSNVVSFPTKGDLLK